MEASFVGSSVVRILQRMLRRSAPPVFRPAPVRHYHATLIKRRGRRPLAVRRLMPPDRPLLPLQVDAVMEQYGEDDASE